MKLFCDTCPVVSGTEHPVADDQGDEPGVRVVVVIITLQAHN